MTRCLIVNPYGIGDVLCTIPLVEAVRRAISPGGRLGYVCNQRTASLVRAMPGVDEVIVFEKDAFRAVWAQSKQHWWTTVRQFAATVRAGGWDTAIDLSLNWQFGAALAALGIRRRVGFDYRGRGRFLTARLPLEGFDDRPVAEYYLDLLTLLNIPRPTEVRIDLPVPAAAISDADEWLARAGGSSTRPLIGLVPGGGASWGPNAYAKQWPAQHFATIADRLCETLGAEILLLGDQADDGARRAVAAAMRHPPRWLDPPPSLLTLAGILTRCQLVVGNDSGALHLAVAVGTPSVTIFGPASPVVYGPLPGQAPTHRVAVKSVPCRPCYARFRLPPCPWEHRCLTTLHPNEVYEIARPLLAA